MGKVKYFVGCYAEWGIFAYKLVKQYYYPDPGWWPPPPPYDNAVMRYDGQHIAGGINNGFIFHFNEWFTLTGTFGLGIKKDEMIIAGDKILTQARFNIVFGVKF